MAFIRILFRSVEDAPLYGYVDDEHLSAAAEAGHEELRSAADDVVVDFCEGAGDDEIAAGQLVVVAGTVIEAALLSEFDFRERNSEVHAFDEARLVGLVEGADHHLGDALRQGMAVLIIIYLSRLIGDVANGDARQIVAWLRTQFRSEEHTSELQSL